MANSLPTIGHSGSREACEPYSLAVVCGDFLMVSGLCALAPATGLAASDDVLQQAYQILNNLETILRTYDCGLDNVARTTVYLHDLDELPDVDAVYRARFITDPKPTREVVQVARLPMGARIEISSVAYLR